MNRLHLFAVRRPVLVLAIAAGLTLAIAPGIFRLRLRTDGHALIPPDAAAVRIDDTVRREFGVRDPLVVLVHSRHADGIFNERTLQLIADLTQAFATIPGLDSTQVRSLATERSDHFVPGSRIRRRLLEPIPKTSRQLEELRGDIDAIGLLTGTLISRDGESAAILAGIAPGADRTALLGTARKLIAHADTAGHEVSIIGAPAAEALLGEHILEDLGVFERRAGWGPDGVVESPGTESSAIERIRLAVARYVGLLPIAIALMGLLFLLCFRSLVATLLPLTEAAACLLFVFGAMGWVGVPVYLTMAVLPVVLVSMGLADEVHVFTSYRRRRAEHPGETTRESVRAALDETSLPVLATGLTTSVGFLAFALSPLAPVRAFGILAAVGIVFCMLWTLTVIPALLVLMPPRLLGRGPLGAGPSTAPWIAVLARIGRRPILPLSIAALALLLSPLAIQQVVVQDSWVGGFARDSAFARATRYFNEHFFGGHRLLLAVDTGHVDLQGPLPAADVSFDEILLPAAIVPDPAIVVGCSLAVQVRAESPESSPAAYRPTFWSSRVLGAELRGEQIVVTTPPVHGSARFLLMPAAAETLDYVLRSQRLAVPDVLERLDELEHFVRARSGDAVGGVLGPPDHIAAAEFLTSDRAQGSRTIPRDQDRVRWLWHSMGLVIGDQRRSEIVDPGLERGLITVFLQDANYVDTAHLMAAVRDYEQEHLTPHRIRLDFAGDVAVSQALIDAIVRSQVGSLLASLLGIVAVSALLFRSLRWGIICVVPATLAVAATFAMMGWTGMPLGVATSMFASMVLGIGVDFAIHLVERYRRARSRGALHDPAILEGLSATGPAILVNALVVTLGFGILCLSQVPANAQLGSITVVSLLACLAATLLVIPSLLRVAAPTREQK